MLLLRGLMLCEVEVCATTDTHCLSVYPNSNTAPNPLVHSNSINPLSSNMDATRETTNGLTGRVIGLGCADAAKKAVFKTKFEAIYTGGVKFSDMNAAAEVANSNMCQ